MAGRKRIEIDLREVERLGGLGLSEAQICDSIGISDETLRTRKNESLDFRVALKRGKAKANGQVANWLYKNCRQGNVTAQIWWEKTRAGHTDKIELSGSTDKPLFNPDTVAAFAAGSKRDLLASGNNENSGDWPPLGEDNPGGSARHNGGRSGP
jgi:hypothetical protein